jgi:hypothetical protein
MPFSQLNLVLDRLTVDPSDHAAWRQLRPAYEAVVDRLFPQALDAQGPFVDDVVEVVWERVVHALHTGSIALGRPGERAGYVKGMLKNRSVDVHRRNRAFGGARVAVQPASDSESDPTDVAPEDEVLADQWLIRAEAPAAHRAALEQVRVAARQARQERYRAEFDRTWEMWLAQVASGLTVEAWVAAEAAARGVALIGRELTAERERVQRRFSRLLEALAEAAEALPAAVRESMRALLRGDGPG